MRGIASTCHAPTAVSTVALPLPRKVPMKSPSLSYFVLAATVVAHSSCGQLSPLKSHLEFAHSPADRLLGTPIGHLEIIRAGISHNFGDRLKICVESEKKTISNASLLLETKLAYVMWLKAAGYGAADFSKFDFFLASKCQRDDLSNMASIVLANSANEVIGDDFNTLFAPAAMSCQVQPGSISCGTTNGMTLGWGAAASLSHSYLVSNPTQWSNVSRHAVGFATLSQFVDWTALPAGIDANPLLAGSAGTELKTKYSHLLALENQSFEQLVAFAESLKLAKAVSGEDPVFQKLFHASAQAGDEISDVKFRPQYAAFHVLFHEIGHTFGMMHADNPNADSITGSSATTTLNPQTHQFSTLISSMAYADQYVYLTDDDVLGISSAAEAARAEALLHR